MFSPAPRRRLLNLTGFFSSFGRLATATDILQIGRFFGALTKGYRLLRRKGVLEEKGEMKKVGLKGPGGDKAKSTGYERTQ